MKKRRLLNIVLSLCMLLALMPQMVFADSVTSITYLDASGIQQTCGSATVVTGDDTTWGISGETTWYVVQGDVTISNRVNVSGTVNLILKDGCTLNASKGIEVSNGNDLTIYAQSVPNFDEDGVLATNNTAGKLNAQGTESNNVGIGSTNSGGSIIINGGCIEATGHWGIFFRGGDITINGGYFVATGHNGIEGKSISINDGVVTVTGNGFTGINGNTTITGGAVTATGAYGGAGIGGLGKTVTISDGSVKAIAQGSGAGIGGDASGISGTIAISGGVVEANSNKGAGIGGGSNEDFGDITISGGMVTADSIEGAGIGGGGGYRLTYGNIHSITISGGVVEAYSDSGSGIGVGGNPRIDPKYHNIIISGGTVKAFSTKGDGIGFNGQIDSTFSTTDLGNAVVFTKSIVDQTGKNNWRGVIFEGTNDGMVYGSTTDSPVTPTDNFTIPENRNLIIDSGKALNIPNNVTLTSNGKIYVDGTFTGTADNLYYPLTVKNATASGDTSEYNSKNYGKAGSAITLSAEPQVGKIITWESSPKVDINDNSFTMPAKALTVTAQWIECTHTGDKETRNAKEATCTEKGYSGDEYCLVCNKMITRGHDTNMVSHKLNPFSKTDATVTETGNDEYWQCTDCNKYFSDADGVNEITDLESWKTGEGLIDKLPPEIIKGKGQSITAGEKKALSFTSNAAYSDFIRVEFDGKTLNKKNYTVKEGSTIVTLKADYVATLPVGEHTIGIVSESGTAETSFTVVEKAAPGISDDSDKDSKSDKDSVKTGDNTNLALWLALMLLSGAGITGVTVYTRRKRTNE